MKVIETLHHGDYYNVRRDDIAATFEAFVKFLQGSPYATAVVVPENRYVRKAFDDLIANGHSGFGWAHYTRGGI